MRCRTTVSALFMHRLHSTQIHVYTLFDVTNRSPSAAQIDHTRRHYVQPLPGSASCMVLCLKCTKSMAGHQKDRVGNHMCVYCLTRLRRLQVSIS